MRGGRSSCSWVELNIYITRILLAAFLFSFGDLLIASFLHLYCIVCPLLLAGHWKHSTLVDLRINDEGSVRWV